MTGFRATLRRSWPVLLSYGVFSVWGVVCLVMSLVLTSGGFGVSPGDLGVLAGVLVATIAGHVGGNLLGLAGLRLMPVTVFFFALFIGATLTGIALGPFALFLVIAVFSALGGYLGVASRLDVVAAWYPLSFCIGGAIIWMNRHGAVDTFHSGSKHAVWDGFTLLCLTGGVFLMLVFLATRHSLGLTVWQEVARPRGLGVQDEQVAVARPGRGSFFVLFVFTMAVLGTTALISPYLFRTRDHDGKDGSGQGSSGQDGQSSSSGDPAQGGASSSGASGSGQSASGGKGNSSGSSGNGTSSGSGHGASSGTGASSGSSGSGTSSGTGGHGASSGSGTSGGASGASGSSGSGTSSGNGTSSGAGGHGASSGQGTSSGSSGRGTSSGSGHGASSGGGTSSGSGGHGTSSGGHGTSSGGHGTSSGGSGTSSGGHGTSSGGSAGNPSSGAPSSDPSSTPDDDPLGSPDTDRAGDAAGEALGLGMRLFVWLLAAVAALLLFLLVVFPPIRRAFLLRHLERPLWPVAPTARVMNLWRRALAALAVADIEPSAGESPRDFARRARSELRATFGSDAPGLEEAAAIVEKIDYAGRGLGAGEEQTMRDAVRGFVQSLSQHITFRKKLGAGWGRAPEVEP